MFMLLVLAIAIVPPVQRYSGRLLGVSASATLEGNVAKIDLRGVPLGGSLSGVALVDDGGGATVDAGLQRALSRRFVSVVSVDEVAGSVHVTLRVPVFGVQTVVLNPE